MSSGELPIRIYESGDKQIIHNLQTNFIISINRKAKQICEESTNLLNNINIYKVYKSCGILGIINLSLYSYIISISECRKIGKIGNTEILLVTDVEFIQVEYSIEGKPFYNFDYITYEITQLVGSMRKLFTEGVYFSREFDLTNSLQAQKNIKILNENNKNYLYDVIKNSNANYLFNQALLKQFFEYNILSTDILVNSIYGYVNVIKENINNIDLSYILISRKDINNLNLKLFSRGFDANGSISNKVETEQILLFGVNVFSYIQIKTPPLIKSDLFSQTSNPDLDEKSLREIDFSKNVNFFSNHIGELNKNYRFIYLINLLNKNNFNENIINNILENNIKNTSNKNFKYTYYNFDANSNTNMSMTMNAINNENLLGVKEYPSVKNRDSIEVFLTTIENVLGIFKFFAVAFDENNKKNLNDQIGILNVFCQDGLERSNIIEMRISWLLLECQLRYINVDPLDFFGADIISVKNFERLGITSNEFMENPKRKGIEFIIKFKKLWKENSQNLNVQYTGIQRTANVILNLAHNNNEHNQIVGVPGKGDCNKQFINVDQHLRQHCLDIITDKTPININSSKIDVLIVFFCRARVIINL